MKEMRRLRKTMKTIYHTEPDLAMEKFQDWFLDWMTRIDTAIDESVSRMEEEHGTENES